MMTYLSYLMFQKNLQVKKGTFTYQFMRPCKYHIKIHFLFSSSRSFKVHVPTKVWKIHRFISKWRHFDWKIDFFWFFPPDFERFRCQRSNITARCRKWRGRLPMKFHSVTNHFIAKNSLDTLLEFPWDFDEKCHFCLKIAKVGNPVAAVR